VTEDQATRILVGIESLKDGQQRLDKRVERVESNVEGIRAAHVENGKAIALIQQQCNTRGKRISEMSRVVEDLKEDTGVFKVSEAAQRAKLAATWKTVAVVAGCLATGAALALGLMKLLG
jgi:hypothetical protein